MFTALLCVSCGAVTAQNLSSMPAAERNAQLIAIAKEVVLTYGPDWYREYGEPVITRGQVPPEGDYLGNANRYFYTVTFLYDQTQEMLEWDFAARVVIWEDTGKPASIFFGNGLGWIFTKDYVRRTDRPVETMQFQQSLFFIIYDFSKSGAEMLRSDEEIIRRGLVRDEYGNWVRTRPDEPPAEAQRVIRRAQEELRERQAQREREGNGGRR